MAAAALYGKEKMKKKTTRPWGPNKGKIACGARILLKPKDDLKRMNKRRLCLCNTCISEALLGFSLVFILLFQMLEISSNPLH